MYSAIILAAGQGTRLNLGYNKVFYKISNNTVIEETIKKFSEANFFEKIIIVVRPDEKDNFLDLELKYNVVITEIDIKKDSRQDSVWCGLCLVKTEFVFIHDGARPYISTEKILELKKIVDNNHTNCALGVPLKDSIRKISGNKIVGNINRSYVIAMQTPQVANTKELFAAHINAQVNNINETDEVGLLLKMGYEVSYLEGEYENKKITTKDDLF